MYSIALFIILILFICLAVNDHKWKWALLNIQYRLIQINKSNNLTLDCSVLTTWKVFSRNNYNHWYLCEVYCEDTRLGGGVDGQEWDGKHATGRGDIEDDTLSSAMKKKLTLFQIITFDIDIK